ncbi:MAG TPA: GNAT family N-acetyltransferase [Mycobacteriales bacterium]|jgi:GNAT superfamily N-acetyltransferase|nr:GNAT family N-acetyltransferase [Mycobacteriales bacterium]
MTVFRPARKDDLPALLALLVDDQLGAERDSTEPDSAYLSAFEAIDADPAHLLLVADEDGEVVGTLQLSVLPGLARHGALRGQIEAVRVAAGRRGSGLGGELMRVAIEEARARGCALVQLTTDLRRERARRFYERLGFRHSHAGMKLTF